MNGRKRKTSRSASVGRGNRPLSLSIWFGLLELAIWLTFGFALVRLQERPLEQGLILYAADHFGEIAIGLATTAYVVFTYFLLASTEAQRRRATEPYLTARWYRSPEKSKCLLPEYGQLSNKTREWLAKTLQIAIDADSLPATEERFVILEVSNVRDVPLTWLQIETTVSALIPEQRPMIVRDRVRLGNLKLSRGESLEITCVDLGAIPSRAEVVAAVDGLVYGSAEGDVLVVEFSGDAVYRGHGTLTMSPVTVPVESQVVGAGGGQQ